MALRKALGEKHTEVDNLNQQVGNLRQKVNNLTLQVGSWTKEVDILQQNLVDEACDKEAQITTLQGKHDAEMRNLRDQHAKQLSDQQQIAPIAPVASSSQASSTSNKDMEILQQKLISAEAIVKITDASLAAIKDE